MRKLKIYLDTSIISFVYADDSKDKRDITIEFFDDYVSKDIYDVYISPVVIEEINKTSNIDVKNRLLSVIAQYNLEIIDTNEDIDELRSLADKYIEEGIIPRKKLEDALHIAICTLFEIDVLLSWNYKHLANVNKERLISSVNIKEGYCHILKMVTPMEVLYEEESI